jgi:hypothetical protein
MTTTATTFTSFGECFRCHGFRRAFSTFSVNGGRCLRCNGRLREEITKPVARMSEFYPDAAARRAESIATIAKALELIGADVLRDEKGRKVSAWYFAYCVMGDDFRVLCAALTIAPEAVRVRGWSAFTAKARATLGDRAEKVIAAGRRIAAEYAGVGTDHVAAWLGEAAEMKRAA